MIGERLLTWLRMQAQAPRVYRGELVFNPGLWKVSQSLPPRVDDRPFVVAEELDFGRVVVGAPLQPKSWGWLALYGTVQALDWCEQAVFVSLSRLIGYQDAEGRHLRWSDLGGPCRKRLLVLHRAKWRLVWP